MGGKALKNYETKRLGVKEYIKLTYEFEEIFCETFGFRPKLIQAYRNKKTFGDADYLIDSSKLPSNWIDVLIALFDLSKEQIVRNGDVTSIGWKNFQIDLIKTNNIDAAYFYFSFNDLGNLIGRIFHKLGIKFGHTGLSLIIRHKDRSDHIIKEIFLTDDPKIVLDILGLSYDTWLNGFDELFDLFKFVASSKYFDSQIYLFDNRSYKNRIRDQKRPTYNKFLKWIAKNNIPSNHDFKVKTELGGYSIRMPYYETEVLTRFLWVKEVVDQLIDDFELDLRFKEVYNGYIVSEQTGYTRKTLGAFMSKMKSKLNRETKELWIKRPDIRDLNIANLYLEVGGVTFMQDCVLSQNSVV